MIRILNYDIAFLSLIIPDSMKEEVKNKSNHLMEDAAIAWQNHIIEGIEKNNGERLKLFNLMPVHAYPGGYKDAFIKRFIFSHAEGAQDINIGFCNVKIIKRMFRHWNVYKEVKNWANTDNGKEKVLIAYTLFHEYTITIKKIKKKYPNITTITIVVDLPMYVATSRKKVSLVAKVYEAWSVYQSRINNQYVDGFVVVTKQMAEILSKNRPYKIVEGICTSKFPEIKRNEDGFIRIIYAGLLLEKFGIMKLVDAFSMIEDSDFRLYICGIGEAETIIKERAVEDKRILFLGQLKRQEVLELMATCNIIVNPRENVGEFTKYSFPSKNMEALSSGIPFVGYKLDGIPDEYDQYINYPKDDTIESLSELLYSVGKDRFNEAKICAELAKLWVLNNKNSEKQGKKILDLIEEIKKL